MKTCLYTGYDEAYEDLARLTVPRMRRYAERHGLHFEVFNFTEKPMPPPLNVYWTGVYRGLDMLAMERFDRAIYLDVDQMVTNEDFDIQQTLINFQHGFHAPRDWGNDAQTDDLSACCLVLHHDSICVLDRMLGLEPEFRDKPFPEQAPMRQIYRNNCSEEVAPMYVWNRKPFNCVPEKVSPGNVPEPWQPGDWCAHLTMLDLTDRIKLFHEIANGKIRAG